MEVSFASDDLDRLEIDPAFTAGFPEAVVRAYGKRLQTIRAALDERDFYRFGSSLHYEKLKGQRQHQRSMRLNKQWRLVLEIEDDGGRKRVRIVAIEDYH